MRDIYAAMTREELEQRCRELEFYLTQLSGLAVEMYPYFEDAADGDHPLASRCTVREPAPECDYRCVDGYECRYHETPMLDRLRYLGIVVDGRRA